MSCETRPDFEQFRGYLHLLARSRVDFRLRSKLDPADLVQQTLLKAHEASGSWQKLDNQARAAWLRQILANTVADQLRRYGRNKRDATLERSHLPGMRESSVGLDAVLADDRASPSQQVIHQEELLALREALGAMPEDQRRAIELHHLDGDSLADVAARMGRSQASVAGLLRRGRRSLGERLRRL